MKNLRTVWRIGALLLVMLAVLSPIGVGARTRLSCDEFNALDAAQLVLDADPSQARTLDADGDGIACNEATEAQERDDAGDLDEEAAEYLETVRDELTELANSTIRFEDLIADGDVDDDEKVDMEEVLVFWQTAPIRAGKLEAPDGLEDIQEAYLATADAFANSQAELTAWMQAEPGSAADDAGVEAFDTAYSEATDLALELDALLIEAGA